MPTLPTPPSLDARGSSPASRLRRSLFRVLDALDDLRPTGIVRVCAGAVEVGRLVASGGRLCMAIPAAGIAATTSRSPEDVARQELFTVAAVALLEGRTLADAILHSGREVALRAALLAEAADGLVRILRACGEAAPTLDVATTRDDYEPRLTLGTSEVFATALRSHLAPGWGLSDLDAVPGAAAALLLRSGEQGELPYPVAQRGLEELGVRQIAALIRLAVALSLGLTPETEPTDERGSWSCLAVDAGLLLARTHVRRPETPTQTPAAPTPNPWWVDPASADTLAPPVDAIPVGMIWPPLEGRAWVREALAERPSVEIGPDGTWQEVRGGRWRLHSSGRDVFTSLEAARSALLDWVRWCAGARSRLSQPRGLFASLAYDGTWRLWQLVSEQQPLRVRLEAALAEPDPERLARRLLELSGALADALTRLAPLGLQSGLDGIGFGDEEQVPVYVGLVSRPGAAGNPGPLRVPALDELLQEQFGPALARLRSRPGAERAALSRHLERQGEARGRALVARQLVAILRQA